MVAMNEQLPSIALVYEAHELFNQLKQGYKEENLERLKEIKEKMLSYGFNAPFKAILKRTYFENNLEKESEYTDIKKQIKYFREVALLKKGALKRVYIAIAAHMLAKSFLKMGYGDVIEYLPFDGNYIDSLYNSGIQGIKEYKKLNDLVSERKESLPVYKAEVLFKGEKYYIKIKNRDRLEEKVANEFGPEGKIMDIKVGKKDEGIIRSKSVRTTLTSTIINYLSKNKSTKEELEMNAMALLLSPIFKFYLMSSLQERKNNNLYPSLANEPSEEHIEIFKNMEKVDNELKNLDKIISEKIKLEKEMNVPSKLIGLGVFSKYINKEKEWISKYFGVSVEDVEKGIGYVNTYTSSGRGREFLENLK
ncbi:MAG: DUF530 family protein [Candidatus ainarchaeum sp.]|nr:DUF530 family protein [Candidatus ainarchaeum sp.]